MRKLPHRADESKVSPLRPSGSGTATPLPARLPGGEILCASRLGDTSLAVETQNFPAFGGGLNRSASGLAKGRQEDCAPPTLGE